MTGQDAKRYVGGRINGLEMTAYTAALILVALVALGLFDSVIPWS